MHAEKRETPAGYDENRGRWILGGIVLVAIVAGAWFWVAKRQGEPSAPVAAAPAPAAAPAIRNPIVAEDEIDPNLSATEQVATLIGTPRFEAMFVPDEFVRRVVVTVDSLARQDVAQRLSPAKPLGGTFVTAGEGDAVVLGAGNFARYTPWVELIDSLDPDATAALYKRLYPQFQKAYEDLGNPDRYFNDRVVEVIDHLLAAPDAPGTIALVQPNVFYEFTDPKLESESAGRKLLLRMGPGNAQSVKAKLREIRSRIAAPAP